MPRLFWSTSPLWAPKLITAASSLTNLAIPSQNNPSLPSTKIPSISISDSFHIWQSELPFDSDRDFLLSGINNGFHFIDPNASIQPAEQHNYRSATAEPYRTKVEKQILHELNSGNYEIVSSKPPLVSALGAIPKPNTDKIRLIHDCSQPANKAVPHRKNFVIKALMTQYQCLVRAATSQK